MRILGAVVFALLVLSTCEPLPAHDDARWIEQHPEHGWCCGPEDCQVVPADAVLLTEKGWTVAGYEGAIDKHGIRKSIDAQWWACKYPWSEIRCLFRPPSFM